MNYKLLVLQHHEILRLAVPSIVTNVTVPLLGLVDVMLMGHIGDERYIGAIAVGAMIFNVVYWLMGFLRMGTTGLTAQAYGKGAHTYVVLRQSLSLALGIGLTLVVLQWPLRESALWLMGADDDVVQLVIPYYNICVWGAPAMLGLYALTGWFIGMQNTRIPMLIAIAQNVVNIGASVFFVFGLDMQIEGVALGTLVAQWMGFGMAIYKSGALMMRRKESAPISRKSSFAVPFIEVPDFSYFTLHASLFLRTLCLVMVNLYFTAAGAQQGTMVLAVNTLLLQFFTIFSYFMDGFANAGEALAGRYYGAGDRPQLQRTVRALFEWGFLMVILFTLLYWQGSSLFLHLLTNDANVVAAAHPFVFWTLLIPICGVAAFVWDGIFVGLTESRGMFTSCFVGMVVFFCLWFTLRSALGNHALWLALMAYLVLRGVVQTFIFIRKYNPYSTGI